MSNSSIQRRACYDGRMTLSQNTMVLLVGNAGGVGLAFLLTILIGREQGETGLGIYAVVLAWTFALSMLVDAGLSTLFTRDLAQNATPTHLFLKAAIQQRLAFGGIVCGLIILGAPFITDNQNVVTGLRISAPLVIIEPLFATYTAIFRARQVMLPIAALNIGMVGAQLILVAGVFASGSGIQGALLVNVLTSLARLALAAIVYQRRFFILPTANTTAPPIRDLMRLALPFAVAALLAALQQRLAILQLDWLSDVQQVGFFVAALRFIDALRMLPNALFGALFPVLSELATDPSAMNQRFDHILRLLMGFGLTAGLGGIFLAQPLLQISFGDSFAEAVPILQVGSWLLLAGTIRAALVLYWYARQRVTFTNGIVVVMIALQLMLGVWVIPTYGALGLMAIQLVVECLGVIMLSRVFGASR